MLPGLSLLRLNLIYILGRLAPAALSFLAIGWYTHLVSPKDYGFYALVMLVAMAGNMAVFQWLRVSVLRLAPGETVDPVTLRSTALGAFVVLVLVSGLVGLITLLCGASAFAQRLLLFALPLTWALAWSDLNLDWFRARIAPWRYTSVYLLRAVLTIGLSLGLARAGWGGKGLVIGALVGAAVPGFIFLRTCYGGVRWARIDGALMRRMLVYGLPLAGTYTLGSLVSGLDRFLLTALAGTAAIGLYAAAYDMARNTLYILMQSVNLAAFPLAVRALEKEGVDAARRQLQHNAVLLAALSFPAAAGLVSVGPALVAQFLSPQFQQTALLVLGPITLATLLSGWRAFYLDQSFQLGHNTGPQLRLMGIGLAVSILLNSLLIPRAGAVGAAWANVGTFGLLALLTAVWGRRVFPLPLPRADLSRILIATTVMAGVLLPLYHWNTLTGLIVRTGVGVVTYAVTALALGVAGVKRGIVARYASRVKG